MSLIYADSSALIRAYFPDEAQLVDMRTLLLEGKDAVVTSEIARLELASAARAASSADRLPRWSELLARSAVDLVEGGPILFVTRDGEQAAAARALGLATV